MGSSQRTLQEHWTTLPPQEVLARAKQFFTNRNPLYATFVEKEGPGYVTLRGQGGEEIALAATQKPGDAATLVTGSTYLFDMQIARFFATLPAPQRAGT
jgi:hypothetical protein